MNRIPITLKESIENLRRNGRSIPEIAAETGAAKTTVQRYVKHIQIPKEYLQRLREKQGGSRSRAEGLRANLEIEVLQSLGDISDRDLRMILIGLYWGEGTKKDLSVINSDARLLQTFLWALYRLGITKERISLSLRVHEGISIAEAKSFWSDALQISEKAISRVEVITGKKKGKLPYGMCRIRVSSGVRERLWIQTAIRTVGNTAKERVVSE